jgi:hypothetical protein
MENSAMKLNSRQLGLACAILAAFLGQRALADDKTAREDALMIEAQKTCPITGAALGEMGPPVKTTIGDQTVFLCCKNCVGKEISKENRDKLTANLIAAQGTCPVLGNPLPKDAASIVVKDRQIFVCCKMCLAKIKADPDKYIAKVDAQLQKNLPQTAEKKM